MNVASVTTALILAAAIVVVSAKRESVRNQWERMFVNVRQTLKRCTNTWNHPCNPSRRLRCRQ